MATDPPPLKRARVASHASLLPVSAHPGATIITLTGDHCTIGRDIECTAQIKEQRISRVHAVIRISDQSTVLACESASNAIGVLQPDSSEWLRLHQGLTTELSPGTLIAFVCDQGCFRQVYRYQEPSASETGRTTRQQMFEQIASLSKQLEQRALEYRTLSGRYDQLTAQVAAKEGEQPVAVQAVGVEASTLTTVEQLSSTQQDTPQCAAATLATRLSSTQQDTPQCAAATLATRTAHKESGSAGYTVPLVPEDANLEVLRDAVDSQLKLKNEEELRHHFAAQDQEGVLAKLQERLDAAIQGAKPTNVVLERAARAALDTSWEEYEDSFEEPDDYECDDCDERYHTGSCSCYKEYSDDYGNFACVTAAVEELMGEIDEDIGNGYWDAAIVTLSAVCNWLCDIDATSEAGARFDNNDAVIYSSEKWTSLLSAMPESELLPIKSALGAEIDHWARALASSEFHTVSGFLRTAWTDPELTRILETGQGSLCEPAAVTISRLTALEKEDRFDAMLNLATYSKQQCYIYRALIHLRKFSELVHRLMLEPYAPPADSIDFSQLLSLQLKSSDTCTPTSDSVLCCLLLSTHATAGGSTSLGLPALEWLLKHLKSVSADDVSCYNAPPHPQGTQWLEPTLAFARESSLKDANEMPVGLMVLNSVMLIVDLAQCAPVQPQPNSWRPSPTVAQLEKIAVALLGVSTAVPPLNVMIHMASWHVARTHLRHDTSHSCNDGLPLLVKSCLLLHRKLPAKAESLHSEGSASATAVFIIKHMKEKHQLVSLTKRLAACKADWLLAPIGVHCLKLHTAGESQQSGTVPTDLVEVLLASIPRIPESAGDVRGTIINQLTANALEEVQPRSVHSGHYSGCYSPPLVQAPVRSRFEVAGLQMLCVWYKKHEAMYRSSCFSDKLKQDISKLAAMWIRDSHSDPDAIDFFTQLAISQGSLDSIAALVKLSVDNPKVYRIPSGKSWYKKIQDPSSTIIKDARAAASSVAAELEATMSKLLETASLIQSISSKHAKKLRALAAAEPLRMLGQLQTSKRFTGSSTCGVGHTAWGTMCSTCTSPQCDLFLCTAVLWLVAHTVGAPEVAKAQYQKAMEGAKAPLKASLSCVRVRDPIVSNKLKSLCVSCRGDC